jgi:NAD(P)-dependent dehydrogenase (short-subunit alcohol dehydrogenase family)
MLEGKVVVVTGGAGLIGQEFISAIVKKNGVVVVADIDNDNGVSICNKLSIELQSSSIDFFNLDVTSEKSINKCIKYIDDKYGMIDALVNNAYPRNRNYGRHFFNVEYDDFIENIGQNLGGCFLPSKLFSQYFLKQGFGNIINISSIYGVISPRFDIYKNTEMTMPVEYAVIKSGLIHLTKYMAKYLKGTNVRVNAISPGGVFDDQPINFLEGYNNFCLTKGMLDKSDLNGTLVFLLSNMSKYINGQNIIVDDGFSL